MSPSERAPESLQPAERAAESASRDAPPVTGFTGVAEWTADQLASRLKDLKDTTVRFFGSTAHSVADAGKDAIDAGT